MQKVWNTLVPAAMACLLAAVTAPLHGQTVSSSNFQGSVVQQKSSGQVLPLGLDDAVQRGLQYNLGLILQNENAQSAGGQRLQSLQSLIPSVTGNITDAVAQTNLQAEGLRGAGFPAIIGPYGYTDFRVTLNQALLNVSSFQNYLASKHDFQASKLSVNDAREMVVVAVGNAYLLCLADASRVTSAQAQEATSKVSLNQAIDNHEAGVSPRLDELRARVDYQTQQQSLIAAQDQYEKDKIALARAIGLPLDQQFTLTDNAPYATLDNVNVQQAMQQAIKNRSDLKALHEQVIAAEKSKSAARAERLPQLNFEIDYGAIGVNPSSSYGTLNLSGQLNAPLLEEGKLRGDARVTDASMLQTKAEENNLEGQVRAEVQDSILDIQAAAKLVKVSQSNVELANEALSEAQERFKAGVSDNLAVSQAQSTVAQANDQYVSSLYQYNLAKLSLARAIGLAQTKYKTYLGGK
ncbi:MAG TPA: TolC family protein [Acidobacteriaceae bacterium]|jgi:outer membrane protein TolC|nr:TolC family protein [Acidobacteriaceae bacterium]